MSSTAKKTPAKLPTCYPSNWKRIIQGTETKWATVVRLPFPNIAFLLVFRYTGPPVPTTTERLRMNPVRKAFSLVTNAVWIC